MNTAKNQTIKTLLGAYSSQLKDLLSDDYSAFFETNLLMQHVLNANRAWLISHELEELTQQQVKAFEALISQRLAGTPIAYILGEREFYGLKLKVTVDTLIPRPDTETLVEAAVARIASARSELAERHVYKILDLGTGSGAIALAIAKNYPQTQVTAVDASEGALKVAQENAQNLNIQNVSFILSNWFDALTHQRFDMIVSNPPYIENNDPHLSQGDLRFEPISALASGSDGLDDIRRIISKAKQHLNTKGWLMFEHGYKQAPAVAELLKQAEFSEIQHVQDLAGIDRVTIAQYLSA
jgi:release factor glutamine methyltransferase